MKNNEKQELGCRFVHISNFFCLNAFFCLPGHSSCSDLLQYLQLELVHGHIISLMKRADVRQCTRWFWMRMENWEALTLKWQKRSSRHPVHQQLVSPRCRTIGDKSPSVAWVCGQCDHRYPTRSSADVHAKTKHSGTTMNNLVWLLAFRTTTLWFCIRFCSNKLLFFYTEQTFIQPFMSTKTSVFFFEPCRSMVLFNFWACCSAWFHSVYTFRLVPLGPQLPIARRGLWSQTSTSRSCDECAFVELKPHGSSLHIYKYTYIYIYIYLCMIV